MTENHDSRRRKSHFRTVVSVRFLSKFFFVLSSVLKTNLGDLNENSIEKRGEKQQSIDD